MGREKEGTSSDITRLIEQSIEQDKERHRQEAERRQEEEEEEQERIMMHGTKSPCESQGHDEAEVSDPLPFSVSSSSRLISPFHSYDELNQTDIH